jgi:UDP:flavonoid glycosyltransferase YjiC (YdhE family)
MVYEMIIESFNNFDLVSCDTPSMYYYASQLDSGVCCKKIKHDDLRIIVSTSKQIIEKFEHLRNTGIIHIPSNIIFLESAPQIEILKRACLFITHSGLNSTSESIYFGVPMIFIPLAYDQPFVAYRCADELGFGVRLDLKKLSSSQIQQAVRVVLNDDSFSQRIKRYSNISKKYIGYINGSRLINNCLTNSALKN